MSRRESYASANAANKAARAQTRMLVQPMRLHEVLSSGRWFRRQIWRVESMLEPFVYRWTNGRLEKARADDTSDTKVSERQFRPGEVLAIDWECLDNEPGQPQRKRRRRR